MSIIRDIFNNKAFKEDFNNMLINYKHDVLNRVLEKCDKYIKTIDGIEYISMEDLETILINA